MSKSTVQLRARLVAMGLFDSVDHDHEQDQCEQEHCVHKEINGICLELPNGHRLAIPLSEAAVRELAPHFLTSLTIEISGGKP